jgi:transposase
MGRRSKYPEEFRRNAAKLALEGGRSVREVARELGVNHETLRNWVEVLRRERRDGPAAVGGEERAELARLRRRVAELELEKEVPLPGRGHRRLHPPCRRLGDGRSPAPRTGP